MTVRRCRDAPTFVGPKQTTTTITQLPAGHYGIALLHPGARRRSRTSSTAWCKMFDVASGKSSLKPPTDGVTDVTITDTAITLPTSGLPRARVA